MADIGMKIPCTIARQPNTSSDAPPETAKGARAVLLDPWKSVFDLYSLAHYRLCESRSRT